MEDLDEEMREDAEFNAPPPNKKLKGSDFFTTQGALIMRKCEQGKSLVTADLMVFADCPRIYQDKILQNKFFWLESLILVIHKDKNETGAGSLRKVEKRLDADGNSYKAYKEIEGSGETHIKYAEITFA